MKNLALAACAAGAMTLASCGDDDEVLPVPVDPTAPTLNLRNPSGSDFDTDIQTEANSSVEVTVAATDPDDDLNTITFQRNGQNISATTGFVREDLDGDASTPLTNIVANPVLIADADDKGSFTRTYTFSASTEFSTMTTYTITVTDEEGLTASEVFTVTTADEPVQRDSLSMMSGIFFNRDGAGFGSLDLVTGDSIRSNNTTATSRLQDAGNGDDSTWDKVIIGEGDAVILTYGEDDDDVDYDDIQFVDELQALAANATQPATGNGRTASLEDGDTFLVRTDDRIYIVNVVSADETQGQGNNLGRWELSYRFAPRS